MALNMCDKKTLLRKMVPEIEFSVSSSGLTIRSKRFNTPRFVPYEMTGKCRDCKSDTVELDFIVSHQGVTIFCSRIKGEKFVKFDKINELPGYCFFKLRSRGRVFNLVHGDPEAADQSSITDYLHPKAEILEEKAVIQPAKKKPAEPMEIIDLTQSPIPPSNTDTMDETIQEVIDANLKVQQFIDSLPATSPPSSIDTMDETIQQVIDKNLKVQQFFDSVSEPSQTSIDEAMGEAIDAEKNLQEFFDSLSAATKHLDIPNVQQMDTTLSSTSSTSTADTQGMEKGEGENAVIRMGKMPWEEEEEEAANLLAKQMPTIPEKIVEQTIEPTPSESMPTQEEMDASLNVQRFFDSLSAATKYLDIPTDHSIDTTLSSSTSSTTAEQEGEKENEKSASIRKMPTEDDETLAGLLAKKPRF